MAAPRPLVPALAALAAVSGCRGASGPKLTLRYHPPAGAAYRYALEQQNSMKFEGGSVAGPEQSVTMRMYFTQAVGGPAPGGGWTAVTVTFDSTAFESLGMEVGAMQPALDRMRGMKSDIVYDDRMNVVSAAFRGLLPGPLGLALPAQRADGEERQGDGVSAAREAGRRGRLLDVGERAAAG